MYTYSIVSFSTDKTKYCIYLYKQINNSPSAPDCLTEIKADSQTDKLTDRQVFGQRCGGSVGGRSNLSPPCSFPPPPIPIAREQMGLTACPSVQQSYRTKQHRLQGTDLTSVSWTEPLQNRTTPPYTLPVCDMIRTGPVDAAPPLAQTVSYLNAGT